MAISDQDFYRVKSSLNRKQEDGFQGIIGLPPIEAYMVDQGAPPSEVVEHLLKSSMSLMAIYPAYPKYGSQDDKNNGLQLYHLDWDEGRTKYMGILQNANVYTGDISANGGCVYVAFLNETSISESFTVQYGDSMFESIGNIGSQTARELRAITGKENMGEAFKAIGKNMKEGEGVMSEIAGRMAGAVGGVSSYFENKLGSLGKILSGSKVDFPQIWQGSAYSPTYSMTIRLFNPFPEDDDSHTKFIIEPLAKLVALTLPISDSVDTYTFPVMCSVTCPGLFRVKAGYISSLEVIKGGESNTISFLQRPSIVDIRMSIEDLYGTMIGFGSTEPKDKFRPYFKDYVSQLISSTRIPKTAAEWSAAEQSDLGIDQINAPPPPNSQEPVNTPNDRIGKTVKDTADRLKPAGSSELDYFVI